MQRKDKLFAAKFAENNRGILRMTHRLSHPSVEMIASHQGVAVN